MVLCRGLPPEQKIQEEEIKAGIKMEITVFITISEMTFYFLCHVPLVTKINPGTAEEVNEDTGVGTGGRDHWELS